MAKEEEKSRAAEDMESSLEARDTARHQLERQAVTNLNQGLESSGHEAAHPGINWGPSYRARKKKKAKQAPKENE